MLEQLYPIFILVGTTIGVVLLYLWRQAHRASDINLALIRLNEQLQFDTPLFLQSAWPLLAQSGLRGIAWELDWFGVPVAGAQGQQDGEHISKEIAVAEMLLHIRFHQNRRSERRYFDETLIETFLLLLRTDMWIKAGAIDATFAQMAKLTLFLQHDMKNVAQFIQLMADQLAIVPSGKEQQMLDYLRTSAPLIRHRADRIVQTLAAGRAQDSAWRTVRLAQAVRQIGDLYRLDCHIEGDAEVRVPENTLDSALDNILKNYSDLRQSDTGLQPQVAVVIGGAGNAVTLRISASNVPPIPHLERLFEPFWSSHAEGLGIGLYQARQLLQLCNGTLQARQFESGTLTFAITLQR